MDGSSEDEFGCRERLPRAAARGDGPTEDERDCRPRLASSAAASAAMEGALDVKTRDGRRACMSVNSVGMSPMDGRREYMRSRRE